MRETPRALWQYAEAKRSNPPDMKKILLTGLTGFLILSAQAQEYGKIQGRVNDPDENPRSFATVLLLKAADSTLAKTGFTDEAGQYVLAPLDAGSYLLQVRFTGLRTYESTPIALAQGQSLELAPIQMAALETELEAVQIEAKKPLVEVKPDMTVFNVADNAIGIGENALELLRKAPGVLVDNNDNILLMGKSGVRIYIDGKPSPLTVADLAAMLKGMQSAQIEAIEIITNPSAKYDAEGNAGIINIRLKKDLSLGTNGSFTLGYAIGRYSKYDGSLNFNSRSKAMNVFGNYSGGQGQTYSYTNFFRKQSDQVFDQRTDNISQFQNHNFKLGTDFFLSEKHTLGFMVNGFISDNENRSLSLTPISRESTGEALNTLAARNENQSENRNINGNLNYGYKGSSGTTLNIDLDYGRFRLAGDSYQPNFFLAPGTSDTLISNIFAIYTPTEIDIYTVKADYERSAFKGTLSAGVKVSYVETDNVFNFSNVVDGAPVLNRDRSNEFKYDENINAAYLTYQRQIEKWNLQVGLRAEQTNTRGQLISLQQTGLDTVTRNYLNLFPTAGLTYAHSPQNSFRVNYSRRIDRPRYQDLNPFVYQLDQLAFQQGNPFLRPQYTHSIQLTHTYKYRFNTSISYSLTDDFFTQITDTFDNRASFISQQNLNSREVISANFSAPVSIAKWWSTYTNLNVSRTQNKGDFNLPGEEGKEVNVARTTFNVYQQHTFALPEGIARGFSGFPRPPPLGGATPLPRRFWGTNAGLQTPLLKKRATLKLSVTDLFNSMQWQGVQDFGGLYFVASGGWESRQFRANLTYNFGNAQVKGARNRKTGIQDESNRVGGSESGPGGN